MIIYCAYWIPTNTDLTFWLVSLFSQEFAHPPSPKYNTITKEQRTSYHQYDVSSPQPTLTATTKGDLPYYHIYYESRVELVYCFLFLGVYTSHLNHARPLLDPTLALRGSMLRVNESRDVALAWLRFASSSASLGPLSERVLVALGGSC